MFLNTSSGEIKEFSIKFNYKPKIYFPFEILIESIFQLCSSSDCKTVFIRLFNFYSIISVKRNK